MTKAAAAKTLLVRAVNAIRETARRSDGTSEPQQLPTVRLILVGLDSTPPNDCTPGSLRTCCCAGDAPQIEMRGIPIEYYAEPLAEGGDPATAVPLPGTFPATVVGEPLQQWQIRRQEERRRLVQVVSLLS
eukprot:TRINITY_DN20956_c0_g1_i1.p3 TRINITY_DN20956_c0_g1~~TRINITY_DN20956_c0_g1_i1.p3  ORF type:complete len:140 (+),score=16.96 TRINITY_DN20956_c0_g1_i1:30-422(+)